MSTNSDTDLRAAYDKDVADGWTMAAAMQDVARRRQYRQTGQMFHASPATVKEAADAIGIQCTLEDDPTHLKPGGSNCAVRAVFPDATCSYGFDGQWRKV